MVFIEAKKNFAFDALYIRVEGMITSIKEMSGANGSREAQKIGKNLQAVKIFIQSSMPLKNIQVDHFRLDVMHTLFLSNYPKIYQALSAPTIIKRK